MEGPYKSKWKFIYFLSLSQMRALSKRSCEWNCGLGLISFHISPSVIFHPSCKCWMRETLKSPVSVCLAGRTFGQLGALRHWADVDEKINGEWEHQGWKEGRFWTLIKLSFSQNSPPSSVSFTSSAPRWKSSVRLLGCVHDLSTYSLEISQWNTWNTHLDDCW